MPVRNQLPASPGTEYGPAPESDERARAWIAAHNGRFGHFINGKFASARGRMLDTRNPATGEKLAKFAAGSRTDVAAAVRAARAAQPVWADLTGSQRARHLYALARTVQRNSKLLAVLETLDNGKPVRESRDIDVPLCARHFLHHAGWAQIQGRVFAGHRPVGVCGQIIPWNFPLLMLAWKIAPALALGNTTVLKPAEQTPLTALLFAELAHAAGLPPGVLNIVTGDGSTGAELVRARGIDKLAFTGSTEVGRQIRKISAGSGKSLTLELGGKSPFVVFDDADLDAAVEGVVDGVWFNQGEVCCAGSRLLVQESVASTMHRKLARRLDSLRVGSPLDKCSDIGAVISAEQLARINAMVAAGVADGGVLHQSALGGAAEQGCFYPPTMLENVPASSVAAREEIFGPVLVTATFRTPDEAVFLANNSRYGLAASVYTENIGLAFDVATRVVAGSVWINSTNLFDASSGFGGCRESGFGREGGIEGAHEYLQPVAWDRRLPRKILRRTSRGGVPRRRESAAVDRTAKLFVAGRQQRAEGGYSYPVRASDGLLLGEAALGGAKDVRDAVEAAHNCTAWPAMSAPARAQVLYYFAENLSARAGQFTELIGRMAADGGVDSAEREVQASVDRLFTWAAWADKHEGRIHEPPMRAKALALREPLGVAGCSCPEEAPLLALVSLAGALLAAGNRVVVLPSVSMPLAAAELGLVAETSDIPAGALNIITGMHGVLLETLAGHHSVDGLWVFGTAQEAKTAELASAKNFKRTLVDRGFATDWHDDDQAAGEILLRHAVQIKNIWLPYGE